MTTWLENSVCNIGVADRTQLELLVGTGPSNDIRVLTLEIGANIHQLTLQSLHILYVFCLADQNINGLPHDILIEGDRSEVLVSLHDRNDRIHYTQRGLEELVVSVDEEFVSVITREAMEHLRHKLGYPRQG